MPMSNAHWCRGSWSVLIVVAGLLRGVRRGDGWFAG